MRGHENYRTKRNTALFFFSFLKELLKKVLHILDASQIHIRWEF